MIGEIIEAVFKGKDIIKFVITGEISFGFISPISTPFNFRLTDSSKLEKIIPNPAFIKSISPGVYQYVPNNTSKMQVHLKYLVSPQYHPIPIRVITLLKSQPQYTDFGLQYEINPSLAHPLRELSFSTLIGDIKNYRMQPPGSYTKEQKLVWEKTEILPKAPREQYLARFEISSTLAPQIITNITFTCATTLTSLEVELLDENFIISKTIKKFISSSYQVELVS